MVTFPVLRAFGETYSRRQMTDFEGRVGAWVRRLYSAAPFLDGESLAVTIGAGATLAVPHRLQRIPAGWIVTDRTANVELVRTAWDAKTITFVEQNTVAGNCIVWVY